MTVLALIVFVLTYAAIISEKVHRTVAAWLGGMILIVVGVISQHTALEHIDWNTLGLLVGMMVIVGIARRSGVFQYLAVLAVKISKGEPVRIMVALASVTAICSALLDNVTTVLLIVPITFTICEKMSLNPIPFLISQVLASNIGGTATLIGDPPNIMIGSQTHLGFLDFVIALAPAVIVIFIVTISILYFLYRKSMDVPEEIKLEVRSVDPKNEIKNSKLLKQSLFVLGLVILGFILHQRLGLESASIALTGAALLMFINRDDPEEVLVTVEWPTLFFFAGLFIVVGGLVETGWISKLAQVAMDATAGDFRLTGMLILWLSAIASAFVDNIPFVATMIPLIKEIGLIGGLTPEALEPLWWSLSLGACLGGNGTIIGASANVIVSGLAEKHGFRMTFIGFMKLCFPLMLVSIVISMVYLLIFFF